MQNRIVAFFLSWLMLAVTTGSVWAQELKQPLSGYVGPKLRALTAAAPENPGDKFYIPTGNLCAQMHLWEQKTKHKLVLGAPIELAEWREMIISGGSTARSWLPAGTRYYEYNGVALFLGPLPEGMDRAKNKQTGCCNPVGKGFVPNPMPVVPPSEPPPPEPALQPPQPEATPAPPKPEPQPSPQPTFQCTDCFNKKSVIIIDQRKTVMPPPPKKKHGKLIGGLVAAGVGGGIAAVLLSGGGSHKTVPVNGVVSPAWGGFRIRF